MFPSPWPADCPKAAKSERASGVVFRVVGADPLTDTDFKTYAELGKPSSDECGRHGVSVYRNVDHAMHRRKLMPHLGKRIAHGALDTTHGMIGKVHSQENTHVNWWPYDGIDRKTLFTLVPE